ncbi:MAG: TlpA disulfide reductase family protein [Chthoniobacteraceae bacterium]
MKITNNRFILLCSPRWVAALVFCATLFSQAGGGFQLHASSGGSPLVWSVTSQKGREIHSSSLIGKVTIVTFWATWCIPCIVEIPTFHNLVNKYEKNGLAVVGVSVDAQSPAMLQAFVDKFKMNYTVAMSNPGMMNNFGVGSTVPMTFVINQQGVVVRRHEGYVKMEDLEKDIRPLLKL